MPLILTLHRARDPSDKQRESRTLEEGKLTIGRGPANDWVLQDPAQYLSKTHCIVTATPRGFLLTDCSSNGVFLNGAKQRMARDSQAPIVDGDEFTMGDYLVRASEVESLGGRAFAGSAAVPRGSAPEIDRDDPFGLDEFMAPPSAAPPPPAPRAPPPPKPRHDPFADPNRVMRDDPFATPESDPFASGFGDALPPRPAAQPFDEPVAHGAAPPSRDPFDTVEGSRRDAFGEDDDLFSGVKPAEVWQGPSQSDHVDASAQAYAPPKVLAVPDVTAASMDEWDDLLGDSPPGTPAATAPTPTAAPVAVAAPPPLVADTPVPPAAPVPAPASAPIAADPGVVARKLMAAFLDGAGVPRLDVSDQEPEAYFHQVGELFGSMVESLRDVLMSRTAVKGEFGVEQTMLRPRDNNALKFSVTPADAVGALLQPGRPGYMPPLRAAKEAFDDVRMHQLAVMAGVQAALFNLLRTFDPASLEARLEKGSVVDSLLPGGRRAKLWEAYCAKYKEIARDADSDFQTVFGNEFARAYTKQVQSQ